MKVEETIRKATHHGYKHDALRVNSNGTIMDASGHVMCWQEILLDPSFWQSLGDALGWGHIFCRSCGKLGEHVDNWESAHWPWKKCCDGQRMDYHPSPILYWHRFIDHLADGKTTEEFFTDFSE